ncbi:MAG: hypothetical protein ABII02_02275 [Candidatus Magasanikbacteria bacterium]
MKILIFTEGTIIMHKNAVGHSREEIVRQVETKESSIHDYASYVPVMNAPAKIKGWHDLGAEIIYLTSRKKPHEIEQIKSVLKKYGFPKGRLEYRQGKEEYKDVAERIMPDVLIEDDCESIGGEKEMTITHVSPDKKANIKSIPLKEFGGIDHLPDNLTEF